MANICDFTLEVAGPPDQLDSITDMIMRDTTPRSEGPCDNEFLLNLGQEVWGDVGESHDCLVLRAIKRFRLESVLGERPPMHDRMVLIGEALYCPPLLFAERIINMFRELHVDLHGTTEHEEYEHWQSEWADTDGPRNLIRRQYRLTNIQEERIVQLDIDGQRILPQEGSTNERHALPRRNP